MAETTWQGRVRTTIARHLKDVTPTVLRNRKLLAMIQDRGNVRMGLSGTKFDWRIKHKRRDPQPVQDMQLTNFSRMNQFQVAELPVRGYAVTSAVDKLTRLMNRGPEAIAKVWDETGQDLIQDMEEYLGGQLYVDGNAAGNEAKFHGLESMFGRSGTVNSNGVVRPSDVYAGLQTDLQYYGGDWNTIATWPGGDGSSHFDFWSPLILSYTHNAAWGGASYDTWAENANKVIRYGLIHCQRNDSKDGMVDLILLDRDLYFQYLSLYESTQRILVNRGENSRLVKLGFAGQVINQDGIDITFEFGVPVNEGYFLNTAMIELLSWQSELFSVDGPEYDIDRSVWKMKVDIYGNLRFKSPRFFAKVGAYGS